MATARRSLPLPSGYEPREPTFCPGGHGAGFARLPHTGWWVCGRCGHPTEAWWRGQVAKINRLARKGLCSRDCGVVTFRRRRCGNYDDDE